MGWTTLRSTAGLALGSLLAGCGGSSGSLSPAVQAQPQATSAQYGPLLVTLVAPNAVTPGVSAVLIVLTVKNASQAPIPMEYVPGPDASATQNGREVWNDGNGVGYAAVLVPITLAPGESRTFSAVWPKSNNEDPKNPAQPVAPGQYVLKAWEVLRINGRTVTDAGHTAPPITVTVE